MGFTDHVQKAKRGPRTPVSLSAELMATGCKVCPLRSQEPHQEATGAKEPIVYMLRGVPEDDEFLRKFIPPKWKDDILRWNSAVRTRPPDNRDPTPSELACCKPSVVEDIERSKPVAIFGFGNLALQFAIGRVGIMAWIGKRMPVKIGKHVCWFYAFANPVDVMRANDDAEAMGKASRDKYKSDAEFTFAFHLRKAFAEVETLPEPFVDSKEYAMEGVVLLRDYDEIMKAISHLYDAKTIGLDYETNMLRPYSKDAKILTIAVASAQGSFAFPLDHRESDLTPRERLSVFTAWGRFLNTAKCRKVVHHLSFELEWSAWFWGRSVVYAGRWGCTESQAFVIDERQERDALSLDGLCLQYFGVELKNISKLDRKNLEVAPLEEVLLYNGVDSKYHRELYLEQSAVIRDLGIDELYQRHLRRTIALTMVGLQGAPVDRKTVAGFAKHYGDELRRIQDELDQLDAVKRFRELVGRPYKPWAPQDAKLLFARVINEYLRKADKTGLAETGHPVADLTLAYRELAKIISTYIVKDEDIQDDGLIHAVFSSNRVRSSRTSADSPNLQNQIKRSEHKRTRAQVAAKPGHKIVSFDYSSIQARNVAMESKDRALVKAFFDHYDIHADWCERIARRFPAWVKQGVKALATDKKLFGEYRHLAKNKFVFPSFFGAGPHSLAGYLELPEKVTKDLHEDFWDMFPSIKGWQRRIFDDYHTNGYVTGLSGYRRHAPCAYNEIINTPIQADETIIMTTALANLAEMEEPELCPILEVHDDLTFHWPEAHVDKNSEVVITEMLRHEFDWINVPIGIEMSIGDDWANMKDAGKFESNFEGGWKQL